MMRRLQHKEGQSELVRMVMSSWHATYAASVRMEEEEKDPRRLMTFLGFSADDEHTLQYAFVENETSEPTGKNFPFARGKNGFAFIPSDEKNTAANDYGISVLCCFNGEKPSRVAFIPNKNHVGEKIWEMEESSASDLSRHYLNNIVMTNCEIETEAVSLRILEQYGVDVNDEVKTTVRNAMNSVLPMTGISGKSLPEVFSAPGEEEGIPDGTFIVGAFESTESDDSSVTLSAECVGIGWNAPFTAEIVVGAPAAKLIDSARTGGAPNLMRAMLRREHCAFVDEERKRYVFTEIEISTPSTVAPKDWENAKKEWTTRAESSKPVVESIFGNDLPSQKDAGKNTQYVTQVERMFYPYADER